MTILHSQGASAADGGGREPLVSRDVSAALRRTVWPALKEHGFTRRTGRTAWRDGDDQIDVITFQSLSEHDPMFGYTSCSFAINLGVHPRCCPTDRVKERDGLLRPEEYQCQFRIRLKAPEGSARIPTNWFVAGDGSNLESITSAARDTLLNEGLDWFAHRSGFQAQLLTAHQAPNSWQDLAEIGCGVAGSPHQQQLITTLQAAIDARRAHNRPTAQ